MVLNITHIRIVLAAVLLAGALPAARAGAQTIQARAPGDPTKDEMRMMLRGLLKDRFKVTLHTETREVPVFALVPAKAGKSTPRFRARPEGSSCSTVPGGRDDDVEGEFPVICGGLLGMTASAPGLRHAGARNVTIGFMANLLAAMGGLNRPVVDRGAERQLRFRARMGSADALQAAAPDTAGPGFMEAVRDQLGLKLESQKGPAEVLMLDHVEHPSEN